MSNGGEGVNQQWRRVNQQWLKELQRFGFDYAEYRAHLRKFHKAAGGGDFDHAEYEAHLRKINNKAAGGGY